MKWLSIIIVLMFVGAFAFWWFGDDSASYAGTSLGPPKAFVKAAVAGDSRTAADQCDPSIESQAIDVANKLAAEGVEYRAVALKETEGGGAGVTYTALVNGKFLTIGVVEDSERPGEWMITLLDFGG